MIKIQLFDSLLENQTLKTEFKIRGLDLYEVWEPSPHDLDLENWQLHNLLEFVDQYRECRSRRKMERMGYLYPPMSCGIDPESDWLRFKRWIKGKPVRLTIREQLPAAFKIIAPSELDADAIEKVLDELLAALDRIGFQFDADAGTPPRLVYEYIWESLDTKFELTAKGGFWHLDGCGGSCPDCFRRPWCETGNNCCWPEDDAAGFMVFPETVRRFVSPAPASLAILRIRQEAENRVWEAFDMQLENPF